MSRGFVRQRITADPTRGDGHNADGIPGDCLRAAVASLLADDLDMCYDDVPHFAVYLSWWDRLRMWARGMGRDFACVAVADGSVRQFLTNPDDPEWAGLMIGNGPSPRGPFWHAALVDINLNLVWDPHPSDAGLVNVAEVFLLMPAPYWPPPQQSALCATPAAAPAPRESVPA